MMREHLIIDGNAVYEIDTDCMHRMEKGREAANRTENGRAEKSPAGRPYVSKRNGSM